MSKSPKSLRIAASRLAFVAITGGLLLTLATAGASAAPFSSFDSFWEFFGYKILKSNPKSALPDNPAIVNPNVTITTLGIPITQNFDTLANSGTPTWTDNSTLIGWYSQFELVPGNPTTYLVSDGTTNTGAIYSFGAVAATERAFGSISSGTPGMIFNAFKLTNGTGATVTSLDISYVGEQWRNGGNASTQQLDFQYQVASAGTITDANTPTTGWLDFNSLDFVSPTVGATAGALDGNAAANRTAKIASLTVAVNNGQEIWLRWKDSNDTGNDHGLAIDDFSVTPQGSGGTPTPTPTPTPIGTPTPTPTPTPRPAIRIHDIQGSGTISPFVGQSVTTTGIVTGLKSNGFFIQEPDATIDADPNTSEGIFVFTGSAPPAAAVVGNLMQVVATVTEFIPNADPQSPSLTELTTPTVSLTSSGNPLPAPIVLSSSFPNSAGVFDQLERIEGMRASVPSLTVVSPTQGTVNEPNATSTSNGVFFGVVTGVARPFREPGVRQPDIVPSGTIPPIPRFDSNPELIRIDSDGQTGAAAIDVSVGATLTNLVGPLDYSSRYYTILPDPSSPPVVSGGFTITPLATPLANQYTISSQNLQRFYDTVDDPGIADPVLTVAAFNNRLNKASLAIRNALGTPDILGVEEMENLTTLQTLATKINNDAVAASQPNPMYQAYLVEGNDVGGIDVGFLVKSSRVSVIDVTQFGLTTTYINPNNGQPELLNDRPPLVLRATITSGGLPQNVTVIVNHLRSLSGLDNPVDGNRVRTKRQKQAEFLANLVQSRQMADAAEKIVLVGDFNAFEFNDGYVNVVNTILGIAFPDNETVVSGDGADLVNPDLTNLGSTLPANQRYSYSFDGNAQELDHILITGNLLANFNSLAVGHFDANLPETARNNANLPDRISDHDGLVAYFTAPAATPTPSPTPTPTPTPTPAFATVDGRVLTSDNRGLRNATVSITDSQNVTRTATTSSFGFFSFDNVRTGELYTFRISSRFFRFAPRNVQIDGNLTLGDFVGLE